MSYPAAVSFSEFYHQHHAWLQRFISRQLPCSQTAEDLAQDSFLRLIARNENLRLIDSPRAYLSTIARGLIANHWRRQDIEKAYLQTLPAEEQASVALETQYDVIEALYQIDRLLQGLPDAVRQAFLMSRLQGMRYQDIATELSVSERMIKHYIARAMLHCAQADMPDMVPV